MSDPYLGEIRLFTCNFAPNGWALCNGQLLSISQNQALFSLLGTSYGGDGITNFALPDLRGRVPVHIGADIQLGQKGGEETHTLNVNEMPAHTHATICSTDVATSKTAAGNVWAITSVSSYHPSANIQMDAQSLSSVGGGQPHENRQPSLAVNFCIALQGIYPTRN